MPVWVEECVQKVSQQIRAGKIKIRPGKTAKETAWAICQAAYKKKFNYAQAVLGYLEAMETDQVPYEERGAELQRFLGCSVDIEQTLEEAIADYNKEE